MISRIRKRKSKATSSSLPTSGAAWICSHGRKSYITAGLAKIYWEAAREPKLQKWYYTSHEFNDPKALVERDQFLETQLKLKPVLPIIQKQMGVK
jgi:hypothetical protein